MTTFKKLFHLPYLPTGLCLVFLLSGSIIGCLQEENPSPMEKKVQAFVFGSSNETGGITQLEMAHNPPADTDVANEAVPVSNESEEFTKVSL